MFKFDLTIIKIELIH